MPEEMENRITALETRLSQIEKYLGIVPQQKPVSKTSEPWEKSPPLKEQTIPENGQHEKSGNWLGIVAVACFVLAAGFIIKLSIDSGWLTPTRQVGLAALFGIGLIGAGFTLMKSDREYASFLPSAGIIVLYLAGFAAHRYYFLIPFETAIALTSLVSALCIFLYTKIRHDIYPITASVGAYLSPVILSLSTNTEFSLYYFFLCSVAFSAISIWVESRTLTLLSAYLAILMTAVVGFTLHKDLLIAVMLAMHFIVFASGTYLYTTQNRLPLSEKDAWSFLPVLLAFYAMEYYFIERIHPGLAPWISLGFAAFLMGLYLSARKYFPESLGSQALVLAFTTIVCFHSVYLELLPKDSRSWLFVIIMLGAAFSPFSISPKKHGSAFYIPAIAVIAILAIEYLSMLFHLFERWDASWLMVSFASFASIWVLIMKSEEKLVGHEKYGATLLVAAHLLAVTGLYRLTTDTGSLAVSASWLCYAVGVMAFAFSRKDETMAKSALFVLAFAAGKALLYDAANAPTILRIGCLLLTGAVLYGCGLLMRKISNWNTDPR